MKDTLSPPVSRSAIAVCFSLVGIFIFLGLLVSYRTAGGIFAQSASDIRNLSVENALFVPSFKKAFTNNLVFCAVILLFASAYPVTFLSGVLLLFKGFCLGAAVGLTAKNCVLKEAMSIFFAVFVSNFLVLPLKVLLFLTAVNFSVRSCELSSADKAVKYLGFVLKTFVFFILMCISECIQLGIGVGVFGGIK